jgi:FlaA1/EpsC-like NDP-sugar epimerase
MKKFLKGKKILVTGVCGTVGRELTRQIISGEYGEPEEFVGIDNNESELFAVEQEFGGKQAHFYLRDLRTFSGLREVCSGIDVIFHAAALKHVGICEKSPSEAVATNIDGLQNLIKAAKRCKVRRFIFTSSDKAVNPTNVMGTSKLMGERLVTAANNSRENERTIFASTRFGNVLGSRGSVVPIFRRQILAGDDITVTSFDMTRFIMTIEEAAKLVIESSECARGGEVFITKMPVVRIEDLAVVMRDVLSEKHGLEHNSDLVEIGVKPGEKMYEELMSAEETTRALETEDFFVVLPAFRDMYPANYKYDRTVKDSELRPYNSSEEPVFSREQLRDYLLRHGII